MSHENVEIVRWLLLPPFQAGDIITQFRDDAISAVMTATSEPFFTPDFECIFVREDAGVVTYSGLDGLRRGFVDGSSRGRLATQESRT